MNALTTSRNAQPSNVLFRVLTMEANRAQAVQEALLECAVYLSCRLEPIQLREYTRELLSENLDAEDIAYALRQIRKQPNRKRWGMPLPAEIIQFLRPEEDETDRANAVAAAIQASYTKFGYNNADKAQAFMGEDAWEVVQQSGGWSQMCSASMEDNKRTEFAQLRDLAKSIVRRRVRETQLARLGAHRSNRMASFDAPQLSPKEIAANKQRASDLIEAVFEKKVVKMPSLN